MPTTASSTDEYCSTRELRVENNRSAATIGSTTRWTLNAPCTKCHAIRESTMCRSVEDGFAIHRRDTPCEFVMKPWKANHFHADCAPTPENGGQHSEDPMTTTDPPAAPETTTSPDHARISARAREIADVEMTRWLD